LRSCLLLSLPASAYAADQGAARGSDGSTLAGIASDRAADGADGGSACRAA